MNTELENVMEILFNEKENREVELKCFDKKFSKLKKLDHYLDVGIFPKELYETWIYAKITFKTIEEYEEYVKIHALVNYGVEVDFK